MKADVVAIAVAPSGLCPVPADWIALGVDVKRRHPGIEVIERGSLDVSPSPRRCGDWRTIDRCPIAEPRQRIR